MRGHRPLPANEPQPLTGEPQMPRHLDATARRVWRRLVPLLQATRVLSETDEIALATLCMTYSRLIQGQKLLTADQLLMKVGKRGHLQPSPALSIVRRESEQLLKLLTHFGMTPATRSRVEITSPTDEIDPLERLLCGEEWPFPKK
jgi:P27 family predicted phage terminase small subunit